MQRLKRIINHETLSGYFSLLSVITVVWMWQVSLVLMALAGVFWWNPNRKNKINFGKS